MLLTSTIGCFVPLCLSGEPLSKISGTVGEDVYTVRVTTRIEFQLHHHLTIQMKAIRCSNIPDRHAEVVLFALFNKNSDRWKLHVSRSGYSAVLFHLF